MRDPNINYRDIWRDDADSMVTTMINNIVNQLEQLHRYADTKRYYDLMLDRWTDEEMVQQWCYNDLLVRGIITG